MSRIGTRRVLATTRGAGVGSNPGKTNLTAWYALEEETGTRYDSHTGALHLVNPIGVPGRRASKKGFGVDVNSSAPALTSAAGLALAVGTSITITCWFYLDTAPSQGAYLVARNNGILGDYQCVVAGGRFAFQIATQTQTPQAETAAIVNTGQWYFAACWFDHTVGANGTIYVQLNNGTIYTSALPSAHVNHGGTFAIGELGVHTYGSMDGAIDEANVWIGRVLTDAERTWLYNDGVGRTYAELS